VETRGLVNEAIVRFSIQGRIVDCPVISRQTAYAADMCAVKMALMDPPEFETVAMLADGPA